MERKRFRAAEKRILRGDKRRTSYFGRKLRADDLP